MHFVESKARTSSFLVFISHLYLTFIFKYFFFLNEQCTRTVLDSDMELEGNSDM